MEAFKHYGDIEEIVKGEGKLYLKNNNSVKGEFKIAKKGEEKLLFNFSPDDPTSVFPNDFFSGYLTIEGSDPFGRKVVAIELLAKDYEGGIINGYAGECEIGVKQISQECEAQFHLVNFLFDGNEKKIEKTEKSFKATWPCLNLSFSEFQCKIEKDENFEIIKKLLKRQGGVLKTSLLKVEVKNQDEYENVLGNVRKLCQLLSVARSTFINWGTCKITNKDGESIYEFYGNAQTKPFHGNSLIKIQPGRIEEFLYSAWKAYDEYEEKFDMKRFLYGYADTYMNSYIETRCLNIATLTDGISSRLAITEGRDVFLNKSEFNKELPQLKEEIIKVLKKAFSGKTDQYNQVMVSKTKGFNRRPLDWKLKRLRKAFNCPISDEEINRFVYLRDSLAHSSLFPDDVDNQDSFLFMRHFLDRIVLRVLGYSGDYFDMENLIEKPLISN